MNISRTKLAQTIATQTLKTGIDKSLANDVAKILLRSNKTSSLNSLMRDVASDWANQGYIDVIARSAFSLSSEVKKDIKRLINDNYKNVKTIKIVEELDSSVVGGVVLEFFDQRLDLSIEDKINKFKHSTVSQRKD